MPDNDSPDNEIEWSILAHLTLDKMATFAQTIFSDTFNWMKRFL